MELPPSRTIPIRPKPRYSASTVAANGTLFFSWSVGANVQILANDSPELHAMVSGSRKFPLWLKDEVQGDSHPLFLQFKASLVEPLSVYSFEGTPTNTRLRESMPFILMLSQHQRQLKEEEVPTPKEADLRLPVDTLISFIFRTLEPSEGNVMCHMCECPLTLPVSSLELSSAIADLAVCIRMTDFLVNIPHRVRDEVTAVDLSGPDRLFAHLIVLHWVMEYKQEAASYQQLCFYLATAVRQRMALGFPEHYVFGAAQVRAGEIMTYAATWSDNQVCVYYLERHVLEEPAHAASFFLFVRCVGKKAVEYEEELARTDKKSLPPFAPDYQSWKAPPRVLSDRDGRKRKWVDDDFSSVQDSISSQAGGAGDAGGAGGAVEHGIEPDLDQDEPHDFIRDDRLWSREVTRWAQEAAEGLAILGDRGEPLRAESVHSLSYVDFLPV